LGVSKAKISKEENEGNLEFWKGKGGAQTKKKTWRGYNYFLGPNSQNLEPHTVEALLTDKLRCGQLCLMATLTSPLFN